MVKDIRLAIIGAGNCASNLIQGLYYYKGRPLPVHDEIGGYKITRIKPVVALDVDANKVGKDLGDAVFVKPNNTDKICDVPKMKVTVEKGPVLDGIGEYMSQMVSVDKKPPVNVSKLLKENNVDVVLNFLPVGSAEATRFYASEAIKAGCGFVNAIPEFIASERDWERKFGEAGLPIIGDDTKAQIGATIVHRILTNLCAERGAKIDRTYQINVGGNSVTGDQEILLSVDGRTKRVKIGDFIDSYVTVYGQKREDGKDTVVVNETKHDIKCFTVDDNYNVVLSGVDALVRHRISEPIYEITTEEGREIKITGDHNVFVLNDSGDLEEIPVKLLKENETCIAVPKVMTRVNHSEMTRVDLTPYLDDMFCQGISDGYIRIHNHPEIRIPVMFPVTDELLQLAGLWLADGNYDRVTGSPNIELACGDEPECMKIVDRFLDDFNIGYNIRADGIRVRLVSKTLAKIFRLALGLSGHAHTKRVPDWVFNLSQRQIAHVVKGYLSGDGCVTGKQIRWTSVSEDLVRDIQTLLMMTGINSTIFKEKISATGKGYSTSSEYFWHGIISSKEDTQSFINKVGFLQEFKNQSSLRAYEKLAKGNTHKIPYVKLLKQWKIKSKNLHKTSSLRAYVVLSQLDKIKNEFEREKIRKICSGDTRFLRIKKISQTNPENIYVYDISTKPFERFICSNILVHNTDFYNMLERTRLKSKKISKTEAVQSQMRSRLVDENIHIGPSDYVPWLNSRKIAFMRIEGRLFGDIPFNVDVRLDVEDKANSSGVVVDAIRCCKLAMDRGIGGALISPSAYFCKHPPHQYPDSVARQMLEEFIAGQRER